MSGHIAHERRSQEADCFRLPEALKVLLLHPPADCQIDDAALMGRHLLARVTSFKDRLRHGTNMRTESVFIILAGFHPLLSRTHICMLDPGVFYTGRATC